MVISFADAVRASSYTVAQYCGVVENRRNAYAADSSQYKSLESERKTNCSMSWSADNMAKWSAPYTGDLHPLLNVEPPQIKQASEIAETPKTVFKDLAQQCKRIAISALDQCLAAVARARDSSNADYGRMMNQAGTHGGQSQVCSQVQNYSNNAGNAQAQAQSACAQYRSQCQPICNQAQSAANGQSSSDVWIQHDIADGVGACEKIESLPQDLARQISENSTSLKNASCNNSGAQAASSSGNSNPTNTSSTPTATDQYDSSSAANSQDGLGRLAAEKSYLHQNWSSSATRAESQQDAYVQSQMKQLPVLPSSTLKPLNDQPGGRDSAGAAKAVRKDNKIAGSRGHYIGTAGKGRVGGGYPGEASNLTRKPASSDALNTVDLRQFLPKMDAGHAGPDGITGPHSDQFKKIRIRYSQVSLGQ